MPIFSLPGRYGIGTFGDNAYRFCGQACRGRTEILADMPLGPTGYGDSPYQSFSTFAGSPYYIDLEVFGESVLPKEQRELCEPESDDDRVDYGHLYETRLEALYHAYQVENYCGLEKEFPDFESPSAESRPSGWRIMPCS